MALPCPQAPPVSSYSSIALRVGASGRGEVKLAQQPVDVLYLSCHRIAVNSRRAQSIGDLTGHSAEEAAPAWLGARKPGPKYSLRKVPSGIRHDCDIGSQRAGAIKFGFRILVCFESASGAPTETAARQALPLVVLGSRSRMRICSTTRVKSRSSCR